MLHIGVDLQILGTAIGKRAQRHQLGGTESAAFFPPAEHVRESCAQRLKKGSHGLGVQPLVLGAPAENLGRVPGVHRLEIGGGKRGCFLRLLRRGLSCELQERAAGAHRLQKLHGLGRAQQEHHALRRLLQQLEGGVLSGGIHGLRFVDDVHLASGLVRQDDRIGGEGTDLVHGDVLLLLSLVVRETGEGDHIRVDPGLHLPAVAADAAGLLPLAGAYGRGSQRPGSFETGFLCGRADQAGVGEPAAREGLRLRHIHPAFPILNHYILP